MRSNRIPLFKTRSTTKKKKGSIVNHIGLEIIMQVELRGILFAHLLAGDRRAILNHEDLEAFVRLTGQRIEEFRHFVRAVINRDYN